MKEEPFYRVSFTSPPLATRGKSDFYFGSMAAIYEMFSTEEIGCGKENLWKRGVSDGNVYSNKLCTITQEVLYRKSQTRLSNDREKKSK